MLERFDRGKRSSLSGHYIGEEEKKFLTMETGFGVRDGPQGGRQKRIPGQP
jgi:hypothetical protein